MKNDTPFLTTPEIIRVIPSLTAQSVSIGYVGYHNFNYVKGAYFFRSQTSYTLHFVLSGRGELTVAGKTHKVRAGETFFLPPNVDFCYYPDKNDPWEYVFISASGEEIGRYASELNYTLQSPIRSCFSTFQMKNLLLDFFKTPTPSYFKAYSLLLAIFDSTIPDIHEEELGEEGLIESIKIFIENKYFDCNFTVDSLLEFTHFSHSYLCRIFKKHTKKTIISYLNERRMHQAKELLLKSNMKVSAISQAIGYKEYTYFLMLFKKVHRLTPSEYRDKFQQT